MFQLSFEEVQKLADIQNMLNSVEVKGINNLQKMYNSIYMIGQILDSIQKQQSAIGEKDKK
jgi:hypothetical protein